jgi:hypothetical protein
MKMKKCPKCNLDMSYVTATEEDDCLSSIAYGIWICSDCPDVEVYDYK